MIHDQIKVRIIAAHRCVKSRQTENTVHRQQERCFHLHQRTICPLTAFRVDVVQIISQSLSERNEIVLSIDANENMRDGKLQKAFE